VVSTQSTTRYQVKIFFFFFFLYDFNFLGLKIQLTREVYNRDSKQNEIQYSDVANSNCKNYTLENEGLNEYSR
jgi:hypothetical protein